ncbi:MAG: hypothetical protein U0169_04175 [Polyangiaceae bacterium]
MLESFRDGGWGMWPILVFGLLAIVTAFQFAVRGDTKVLRFVESLAKCVLFASVTGFVTGLIATSRYFQTHEHPGDEGIRILVQGTAESANDLAFGFAMLTVIHLVLAVGKRRYDARGTSDG